MQNSRETTKKLPAPQRHQNTTDSETTETLRGHNGRMMFSASRRRRKIYWLSCTSYMYESLRWLIALIAAAFAATCEHQNSIL